MKRFLLIGCMILISVAATAQHTLKGFVLEYKSNEVMSQVEVKNLDRQNSVRTEQDGSFAISAEKDEVLTFYYPGYRTDSVVVLDFDVKRIYLTPVDDPTMLDEVNITSLTNSRLSTEMERLRQGGQIANAVTGGGIGLSPSRIFGSSGRTARRQYRMLEQEANNRKIDSKFSVALVQSLTPLEGDDLDLFMIQYRPKINFVNEANDEEMRLYVADSYKKFRQLSDEQKAKIRLNSPQDN